MWSLDNRTPFAAERTWVRDAQGRHRWIVAVKATYTVDPGGRLTLADEQIPPRYEPEYYGEPGTSSVRYEADLIPEKPGTDVIVNAHAHAPDARPAQEVTVGLSVAGHTKTLRVFGERAYYMGPLGLATTTPLAFTSAPICYELAYGGADTEDPDPRRQRIASSNPVGRGVAIRSAQLEGKPAHRIEYPGRDFARSGPAGFGALASYWSPRLELGGTYDAKWEQTRQPLVPDDYDSRCLLCSPEDQRPPGHVLRGGEPISLVNMTPSGSLRFEVPTVHLSFRSMFGRRRREHHGRLATVVVDAEQARVLVVWHTSLEVGPRELELLDRTIIELMEG